MNFLKILSLMLSVVFVMVTLPVRPVGAIAPEELSAPAAVLGLKQILDDCVQSLTAASAAKTLTQLGAQVKYCHLECICRMAAYASVLTQ